MLQNWIGSMVKEGKNFETQRREGAKARRKAFFKNHNDEAENASNIKPLN